MYSQSFAENVQEVPSQYSITIHPSSPSKGEPFVINERSENKTFFLAIQIITDPSTPVNNEILEKLQFMAAQRSDLSPKDRGQIMTALLAKSLFTSFEDFLEQKAISEEQDRQEQECMNRINKLLKIQELMDAKSAQMTQELESVNRDMKELEEKISQSKGNRERGFLSRFFNL